ncbi:MAG: molecular chaperone HtpG [Burkholderiaceae bacterium]|nr:molecular chaperone HtpG [Burkholderiaceae bacterium]
MSTETLAFQTEVKQLLHLMIHSLYSNKEIFLRELISNSSDALDKLRFSAIAQPELLEGRGELGITISFDKAAKTITISDNGIGMSREEAIANLGTIARSGTKEFFSQLSGDQQKDASLIGQFGVGFYSAFIVAHKVSVLTRGAGKAFNQAVLWESEGTGEFSITDAEKASPGTEVTLYLREEDAEFASRWKLASIVKKYSDHVGFPIRMRKETWDAEKSEYVQQDELETINQASSLWTRSKNDITQEQYDEFYKSLSHDNAEPLSYTHNRVEGRAEYIQLLYVPSKAPFDLFDRERAHGVKLYVKRVFIMDDAKELLPQYLRFIKGVIDSSDLPLNVSREILQESRDVKAIREGSTKRVLGMLEDLAENHKDKYALFYKEFGQVLKEGMGEDFANQERIAKLLRFSSTQSDEQAVSLDDYVARFKEGQKAIYYLTAENLATAKASPHLELLKNKGIEVLLLTDRIDEWMLAYLNSFADKPLQSVAKGALDLGSLQDEEEKKAFEATAGQHKALVEKIKTALGDRVKEVRATARLTHSPACLVVEEHEMSGNLQRLLKQAGQKAPETKPILEINPTHPLVSRMEADSSSIEDLAHVLLDNATLAEGGSLEDPAGYVSRINKLLLEVKA